MHPVMNQLSQLPVSERLELVQELWDSIADDHAQMPIQDWQRELVKARLSELSGREEETGISRDELWRKVDELRGT